MGSGYYTRLNFKKGERAPKAERPSLSSPKEAPRALKADFMAATLPTHMQGLSVSKSDGNAKSSQDQSSVRTRTCICQAGWPGPFLNPP